MILSKINEGLEWADTRTLKLVVLCLSALVIVFFGLAHPLGVPPDYEPYLEVFDWARGAGWSEALANPKSWEPGFMLLVFIFTKLAVSGANVFSIFVVMASSVKLVLLYKLASPIGYLLAMGLFFFKIFPLQDYNQLRGALAVGFLMLVYYEWVLRGNVGVALACAVGAVAFHYLALAVLPLLLLIGQRIPLTRTVVLSAGALLAVLIALSLPVLLDLISQYVPRVGGYLQAGWVPAASSYLSPALFPEFLLIAASVVFWDHCTENMKRIILLQMLGFGVFYGLFDIAVISSRIREVLAVFWLFYIADFSRTSLHLRVATVAFVLLNVVLGTYLFYITPFFEPLSDT